MKSMIFVTLLVTAVLVGCSTPIKRTLNTAQQECDEMQAHIKNVDGVESVIIRCTWHTEEVEW